MRASSLSLLWTLSRSSWRQIFRKNARLKEYNFFFSAKRPLQFTLSLCLRSTCFSLILFKGTDSWKVYHLCPLWLSVSNSNSRGKIRHLRRSNSMKPLEIPKYLLGPISSSDILATLRLLFYQLISVVFYSKTAHAVDQLKEPTSLRRLVSAFCTISNSTGKRKLCWNGTVRLCMHTIYICKITCMLFLDLYLS